MGTGKGHLRDSEVSSWVIWWCYLLRWGFQKELFWGGGNDAFGLGQPFSDRLWITHRVPGTALHSLFPDQPGAVDLLSGRDM